MEPFDDEEAAEQYMLDTTNEDTRANTAQQIGEEDARTADSFLNMSGDGDEEDDDFAPAQSAARSSMYLNYIWMVT